jgi:hypothetical protein
VHFLVFLLVRPSRYMIRSRDQFNKYGFAVNCSTFQMVRLDQSCAGLYKLHNSMHLTKYEYYKNNVNSNRNISVKLM